MSRGCKGKGIALDKKESGFMACLFIRCADVAMEIGLVVYRPPGAMSCPEAGSRHDGLSMG